MANPRLSRRAIMVLLAGAGAARALIASPGMADAPDAEDKVVEGSVVYRERMMLPPGARVEVELADVSRADAPSVVLGRVEIADAAASPIRYRLSYDPALIESGRRYALQARISMGQDLLFINDTHHAFEPGQVSADILVKRVAAPAGEPLALFGSWLAEDILGGGVIDRAQTTLEIAEDGAVSGSGGCNRYSGSAVIDGDKLTFAPLASTNMACVGALMNQEHKFQEALGRVASFRLVPGQRKLLLLDSEGGELVRLAAM